MPSSPTHGQDPVISILLREPSPRLRYAVEVVFRNILGTTVKVIEDETAFSKTTGARIEYGERRIFPDTILVPRYARWSTSEPTGAFPPESAGPEPVLFPVEIPEADLHFDLFAAAFFLLSRWEEYTPDTRDRHGRFRAAASWQAKAGLTTVPILDQWVHQLRLRLQYRFPEIGWPRPEFRYQPSYDLDLPLKYGGRPVWRYLAATGRELLSGKWNSLGERLAVATGRRRDPYDTFDFILQNHRRLQQWPLFFAPVGNYGVFDKNLSHRAPYYRRLIRRLSDHGTIGLHPSYRSVDDPTDVRIEKERLEDMLGKTVLHSRQHYLRLQLPTTYRRLAEAGIMHEYSMGFAETPGFRSGTAFPHPWYDLERDEISPLMIYPFAVMDVSLQAYRRETPEAALEQLKSLARNMRATGGTLITIWHNNSLAGSGDWLGWDTMYLQWLEWIAKFSE